MFLNDDDKTRLMSFLSQIEYIEETGPYDFSILDKINKNLETLNISLGIESAVYNLKQRALYLNFIYDNNKMLNQKIKDVYLKAHPRA